MTDTQNSMQSRPSDGPSAVQHVDKPKRKIPGWGKIAIGTLAGLIVGGAMASAGAAGRDVASPQPAPTVTVTAEADDSDRVAELEGNMGEMALVIADCQTTVTVMDEAVQVVLGAFDRQITATYDAAVYGASQALIDEQNAISAEIDRATAILVGAPGCR